MNLINQLNFKNINDGFQLYDVPEKKLVEIKKLIEEQENEFDVPNRFYYLAQLLNVSIIIPKTI